MRLRALLLLPLATTAIWVVGSSTSSAATLWTTSAHTARVTAGATAGLTLTDYILTSGSATVLTCSHASFNMTIAQNTDAGVVGTLTGSTWNGCSPFAITGTHATPWKVTVSGTSFVSGTETCWSAGIDNVTYDQAGGLYSGNLTTGVRACQPTATATPIRLRALAAGTIVGPLTGDGRIDTTIDVNTAWSLTN